MGSTYCLVVSGPMSSGVMGILRDRFEDVRISTERAGLVIQCFIPDQAALRALLTQVWDVGGAVLLVAVMSNSDGRSRHGHDQR